jgi:hypothetical protein
MTAKVRPKRWEKTRLHNLVRHKSGRYYARAFASGKEVWKSLKTNRFAGAQGKLADLREKTLTKLQKQNASLNRFEFYENI